MTSMIDLHLIRQFVAVAEAVVAETIPNATHHVHLDRPERARDRFLRRVIEFLAAGD